MNARKKKEVVDAEVVETSSESTVNAELNTIDMQGPESKPSAEVLEQVSTGGMATESNSDQTTFSAVRPNLMRAHSRQEQRRMQAQLKRMIKPKRGHTKPLHDKAKSKARKQMQKASRRANRISRQRLKTRV